MALRQTFLPWFGVKVPVISAQAFASVVLALSWFPQCSPVLKQAADADVANRAVVAAAVRKAEKCILKVLSEDD